MFDKIISLVMCILILISVFTACEKSVNIDGIHAEDDNTPDENVECAQTSQDQMQDDRIPDIDSERLDSDTDTPEDTYQIIGITHDPLDPNNFEGADIPENVDYGGYKFSILADSTLVDREFIEETNGSIIQDALIARQEYIEDFVGIKFDIIRSNGGNKNTEAFISEMLAASGSGAPFDLVLAHNQVAPVAAVKGVSRDLSEAPALNLKNTEKSYWNKWNDLGTTVGGRVFWISDKSSWNNVRNMLCLYVNTDLLSKKHPSKDKNVLYALVHSEQWTFENLISLVQNSYSDSNSLDENLEGAVDNLGTFGLQAAGSDEWLDAWFYAAGFKYTKPNSDAIYEWTLSDQSEIDFINWWQNKLNDPNISKQDNAPNNMFTDKRAMFALSTLGLAEQGLGHNWAVLPLPMYDKNIKNGYSTPLVNGYTAWLIPKAVSNEAFERSATVLELIAAEGNRRIAPAYAELYFKRYSEDDWATSHMIPIIRYFAVFDIGTLSSIHVLSEYLGRSVDPSESLRRVWAGDGTGDYADIATAWSGIKDSAVSKLHTLMLWILDYDI